MKSITCLFTFFVLLLVSCQQGKNPNAIASHSLDSIYNYQLVKIYLSENKEKDTLAESLFKKGLDAYRNKKKVEEAQELFEKSLHTFPAAHTYYELGNVLLDVHQYHSALQAYYMAEKLNYQPASKLLYNTACALAQMNENDKALNYLEYAIEAGYSNAENIMKDKDLAPLRQNNYSFHETVMAALSGSSDPALLLWHTFKRSFQESTFPLVLNKETKVDMQNDRIAYDFEKFIAEMRDNQFSREVGKSFYYVATVEDNAQYTALVYGIVNEMMGENAPMNFVLISFDKKGTLIDKKFVGGQNLLTEPYKVCTIQENLSFELKEYELKYEKNPEEEGYIDNKIVSNELKDTRQYKISDEGHFVELSDKLSMR